MNRQHTQLIDRLEETGRELAQAVARVSPGQMMRAPSESEWSLHMSLAHLRDTEVYVFLYRAQRILKEGAPAVAGFSQDAWNREHYSPAEPVKDILAEFRTARRKLVKLLRDTKDKDWARYAVHPEYGKIPLEYIALHTYAHTLDHLTQFLGANESALLAEANGK